MLFLLSNVSNAPKWSLSYFQPILVAIFVPMTTVKVELMPELYTLAIVLINYNKKKLVKNIFYFLAS